MALHESVPDLELATLLPLLDAPLDGRQLLPGLEGDEGRQRTPEHHDEPQHASDDAGSSLDWQVGVCNQKTRSRGFESLTLLTNNRYSNIPEVLICILRNVL